MGFIIPSEVTTTFSEIDHTKTVITPEEYKLSKIYPIREAAAPYLRAGMLPPKEILYPGLRSYDKLHVDLYGDIRNQLIFKVGNKTVGTPLSITENSITYQKVLYKDAIAAIELPWDIDCDCLTTENINDVPKKYVKKVTPVKYSHLNPSSVKLHTEIFWDENGDDVWYTVLTLKTGNYTIDYIIEPQKVKIYKDDKYIGAVDSIKLEDIGSVEEIIDFLDF